MKKIILTLGLAFFSLIAFSQTEPETPKTPQTELQKIGLELTKEQLSKWTTIHEKYANLMNDARATGRLNELSKLNQDLNKELKAVLTKEQIDAMNAVKVKENKPE